LYAQFIRFLTPLVIATVALELGGQFLNAGTARVPRATETLAAFGLAYGLMTILSGPLYQTRQMALALIDNRNQLARTTKFVAISGLLLSIATAVLGLHGPGRWIVQDLHQISPQLADSAQTALIWMSPLPLINGLARYYSGLLARYRRTEVISASNIAGIIVRIACVFALLAHPLIQSHPIFLPIIATFAGAVTEYGVLIWGHFRFSRPALDTSGETLTTSDIFRFLWPLAVIMTFQSLSRPLINFVVSRGDNPTEALAALTVCYTLGHLHYGWVNETRSLAPAFRDQKDSLIPIRNFIAACCGISFILALVMFWTPLKWVLLTDLIGVDQQLAELCIAPLMIFSFFPFAVALRGYYHGLGVLKRVTDAMAASAPSRITAIAVALFVFSFTDVPGATRGIGALFCGFAAESTVVAWGVRRRLGRILGKSHA